MTEAFYINNKNHKIILRITHHVKKRFVQRWSAASDGKEIPLDIDMAIIELFNSSIRVRKLSRKEKTRLRRYGKDTLFFRISNFTFVVQDASIITVELSSNHLRRFNKETTSSTKKHFEQESLESENIVSSVKLTAFTINNKMLPKYFNLGSYSLNNKYCDIESLKKENSLLDHIKYKINEKIDERHQVVEVLAYYKKGDDRFTLYNENEINEILKA